jgi:tetratricopeptide (TPR) repeat protein
LGAAKTQVDRGQSGLARATLRRAAEEMRREEEERRERFQTGVTVLYAQERDIALAAYDGEAAAGAILALAETVHGANTAIFAAFLNAEATTLHEHGKDRGSNAHLAALIVLRRTLLSVAISGNERRVAQLNLGTALWALGQREVGTARLEEAVSSYRAALEGGAREPIPLEWAKAQNSVGVALRALGEGESGTTRLEEAVAAFRAALEVLTRERVPLDWAKTQNNLGAALELLGAREKGTARLTEAVVAYRAALEERTREQAPQDWAETQNNLGNALEAPGERDGAARGGSCGLSRGS